jgi:hypothetical protein
MADELELLSEISSVETIATGSAVEVRRLLSKAYGTGNWRKCKGIAGSASPMDLSGKRKYTGTRLMGAAESTSRSSAC